MEVEKLKEHFDPKKISWRVGSTNGDKTKGMALAYLDARDVMQRLDDVCGMENWQCEYTHVGDKTCCKIGVKVNNEWVWKSNGAGDTDFEGEKGAFSDAFKRAAVLWGIGQYLYDVKSTWVEIEPMGKSFKIKDKEYDKLNNVLIGNIDVTKAKEEEFKIFWKKDHPTQTPEEYYDFLIGEIEKCLDLQDAQKLYTVGQAVIKWCIGYNKLEQKHFDGLVEAKDKAKTRLTKGN